MPESPKTVWTPHPVLAIPAREQVRALADRVGAEEAQRQLAAWHAERERKIRLEVQDPLRHGFETANRLRLRQLLTTHDEVLVMGANRSGKTEDATWYAVDDMANRPARLWAMFEASERASINKQQPRVHKMLPPEWRDLGKVGNDVYVKWTKATGFSNLQFILPNQSQGMFFNYKQAVGDFEGYELDGAWCDELVPLEFVEALTFRVGRDRVMKLIVTFTPVTGYTPVVARFLAGARVVESKPVAPEMHAMLSPTQVHVRGCPPGHLPYVMQGKNPRQAAIFYHWGMNPYAANKEVLARLAGKPKAQWLIRAYGWVDKPLGAALAKYGAAHRITREKWQEIERAGVTRYCVIDPGGTKNWFIKWYAVTPQGWRIVYREWPDYQRYGPWALPPERGDKVDWRPGEAQRLEAGRGIDAYKRLMLESEGWQWNEKEEKWDGSKAEPMQRRLIDSRLGGAGVPSQDEGTSIIDLLGNETRTESGKVRFPRMLVDSAPGRHVQHGLQLLQQAFDYDEARPINAHDNCPKWYVVDDLEQSDLAYKEYSGLGSDKDALKDIMDPDRYFIETGYGYVNEELLRVRGGTYY